MSRLVTTMLCCLGLAAVSIPLQSHHSFASEFDTQKPFKVTGTVTKVEWTNPHIWFHTDVKDSDGKLTSWAFEMGSPNNLMRLGWTRNTLKSGDVVTVEGFLARRSEHIGNARAVVLANTGKRLFTGQQ